MDTIDTPASGEPVMHHGLVVTDENPDDFVGESWVPVTVESRNELPNVDFGTTEIARAAELSGTSDLRPIDETACSHWLDALTSAAMGGAEGEGAAVRRSPEALAWLRGAP